MRDAISPFRYKYCVLSGRGRWIGKTRSLGRCLRELICTIHTPHLESAHTQCGTQRLPLAFPHFLSLTFCL